MATVEEILVEANKPLKWFKHDVRASQDEKCQKLLLVGGYEAYGRFWKLCELLADKHGHAFHTDDVLEVKILANTLQFDDTDDLQDFLDTLARFELIDSNLFSQDNIVTSSRMNKTAYEDGAKRIGSRERKRAYDERQKKS